MPPPIRPLAIAPLIVALVAAAADAWPVPTREERAFDDALARAARALDFSDAINPDAPAAAAERARFDDARRAGRVLEPRFVYAPLSPRATRPTARLSALPAPRGAYAPLLLAVRAELLAKRALLDARGTPGFAAAAAALYPPPDQALVRAARRILRAGGFADPPSAALAPEALRDRLDAALSSYGLRGWRVELSEGMAARAAVQAAARRVKVNRRASFTAADVDRLVHHEIGVHAVRGARGERMPLGIFRSGLAGYLDTEEGLAAHAEVTHGIRAGLRLFALRVLAVDAASRGPFSATYALLRAHGADEDEAWQIALRAKRGLGDTGIPGAYTKDAAYLRGYLSVRAYLARGGSLRRLMRHGKIGLGDLPAVDALARTAR